LYSRARIHRVNMFHGWWMDEDKPAELGRRRACRDGRNQSKTEIVIKTKF
jgi:hypothetical protein